LCLGYIQTQISSSAFMPMEYGNRLRRRQPLRTLPKSVHPLGDENRSESPFGYLPVLYVDLQPSPHSDTCLFLPNLCRQSLAESKLVYNHPVFRPVPIGYMADRYHLSELEALLSLCG